MSTAQTAKALPVSADRVHHLLIAPPLPETEVRPRRRSPLCCQPEGRGYFEAPALRSAVSSAIPEYGLGSLRPTPSSRLPLRRWPSGARTLPLEPQHQAVTIGGAGAPPHQAW